MLPFLRLGPFLLQVPELTLVLGIFLAADVAAKEASARRQKAEELNNLIYYGFFAAILGARLVYALNYFDVYVDDPLALFTLNTSTLAFPEGLLIGAVVSLLYGFRRQLPLRPTLDALAPGLAVFMMALALSHLFSGSAYGTPSQLPWAISLWGELRHPTQVYDLMAAILIFVLLRSSLVGNGEPGTRFLTTAGLFVASRIFVEAFRAESQLLPGGFRVAQVAGLLALAGVIWLMARWAGSARSQ